MALGKPKYIETPEKMWEYFIEYQRSVKDNPFQRIEQKKGSVVIARGFEGDVNINDTVELPLQRPLTMEGFENWLFINDIITDVSDYFENKEKRYSDYVPICRAIKRMIRQDQIEGGMAGIYNPSITQRLNGLTDKQEQTVKVESFDITLDLK